MHDLLTSAKNKLTEGGYTCVILSEGREYSSRDRGVKPLITLLESGESFAGAFAADKTVGAGAAHLYVLIGVGALWANVISVSAKQILEANGIDVYYRECVPYIINRQGDGICPIEYAVRDAKDSREAYRSILDALAKLSKTSVNNR